MARHIDGLRDRKSKSKVDAKALMASLNYHEGLSANQVKIVLTEFGLGGYIDKFNYWMDGQTCPVISRRDRQGRLRRVVGVYEYDLFRWIESKRSGVAPVWD